MSKKHKWRENLPNIDWQHPDYILQINQALNAEPVSYLEESKIDLPQTGSKTIMAKWAADIFQQQGGYAEHPIIGIVSLDKKSAEKSLGHGGFSKYKNMAFLAVKDVIENGIVIAVDDAREDERSYFISAPIIINSSNVVATVLVHKDMNIQKMYLHSVIEKENLLMPLQCRTHYIDKAPSKHPTSLTSTDIHNLLHAALTVNSKVAEKIDKAPSVEQKSSIIDLSGLCPREAGKMLFKETQGDVSQLALMMRSATAAGLKLDTNAIIAAQGQHSMIIQEVMMKAVKIDPRNQQQENSQNKTSNKEKER